MLATKFWPRPIKFTLVRASRHDLSQSLAVVSVAGSMTDSMECIIRMGKTKNLLFEGGESRSMTPPVT